ncbi:hypothetical protein OEZ85_004775 [Tetradesmus obliquus]|uniref:Uncharacterized protein n=1 Tax=Tetradesmus obliquus TaxID=3088 RepID=A0ABY8ULS1_TETOB|nr:hypothetical protein OEZ85_004775 [Tetradesmus obliquus]
MAVTCAASGSSSMLKGEAELCYVPAEALFLAVQVENDSGSSSSSSSSNMFAFRSLGAEGRYLAASRDLSQPPVLEAQRVTPAGQWRLTPGGLVNVQHSHKKLGYSVHEAKAVPLEGAGSLAGLERVCEGQTARQQAQASANEAACKQLERTLQDITAKLVADRQEHADKVEHLTEQLCVWKDRARRLDAELRQQQQAQQQASQQLQELQAQHQRDESELGSAYQEVAALQQQLAEQQQQAMQQRQAMQDALARELAARDAELAEAAAAQQQRLEQQALRHAKESRQWAEVRSRLEHHLHGKDDDIAALSGQVTRLDHALKQVQRLMGGNSRRQQLDRASLDAVSIQQLQAAVAQFAQGEVMLPPPSPGYSSLHESRALHALLVSSQASDGSAASTHEQDAVPQLTLPLQDAPHHSSQQQHRRPLSAQAYYGSSGGDLGPAADQSPGGSIQESPRPALSSVGALTSACEAHDSPLLKLAASASASTAGALLRGSQQQQRAGALGSSRVGGMSQRSRPPVPTSASVSAGANWLAAAAAAGKEAAGSSSWAGSSGTPGRHGLRTGSNSSSVGGSRIAVPGAGDEAVLPGAGGVWGMADVGASGGSRRAASSAASEEHAGGHRYSCSDLSDADSGSTAGDDADADATSSSQQQSGPAGRHEARQRRRKSKAAAGQQQDDAADLSTIGDADADTTKYHDDDDDGDLDAIHSLGQSMEEDLLRQQLRISSQQLQKQQQQRGEAASSSPRLSPRVALAMSAAAAAATAAAGGAAARRSSGSGLLPVKEEEQHGEAQANPTCMPATQAAAATAL